MTETSTSSLEPVSLANYWPKLSEFLERVGAKYELKAEPDGVTLTRADGKVATLFVTKQGSGKTVLAWHSFSGNRDVYQSGGASVANVIYNLES
jgi:hypothetical protein